MIEHNAQRLVGNFSKNLKEANSLLKSLGKDNHINAEDLERLSEVKEELAISTRAYLNDLDMLPSLIRMITPLMNGELNAYEPDFMKKITQLESNFKTAIANVKEKINTLSDQELLNLFPGLKDSKDVKNLPSKIAAIERDFTTKINKLKSLNASKDRSN